MTTEFKFIDENPHMNGDRRILYCTDYYKGIWQGPEAYPELMQGLDCKDQ